MNHHSIAPPAQAGTATKKREALRRVYGGVGRGSPGLAAAGPHALLLQRGPQWSGTGACAGTVLEVRDILCRGIQV